MFQFLRRDRSTSFDTSKVSGRLQAARGLITGRKSFVAIQYGTGNGAYCMLGALAQVQYGHHKHHESSRETREWNLIARASQEEAPLLYATARRSVDTFFCHPSLLKTSLVSYHSRFPEFLIQGGRGQRCALKVMDRAIALAQAEEKEAEIRDQARVADEAELLAQMGKNVEQYEQETLV